MSINTVDEVARESRGIPMNARRKVFIAPRVRSGSTPARDIPRSRAVVLLCVELLEEAVRWRGHAIVERVAEGHPLRARPGIVDYLRQSGVGQSPDSWLLQ